VAAFRSTPMHDPGPEELPQRRGGLSGGVLGCAYSAPPPERGWCKAPWLVSVCCEADLRRGFGCGVNFFVAVLPRGGCARHRVTPVSVESSS
jgi:hypothetical protein